MIELQGDLWRIYDTAKEPKIVVVTGNSTIKKDGSLVMGAGAALEAKQRWPTIATDAGLRLLEYCGSEGVYGFWFMPNYGVGLFQTKRYFKDNAEVALIAFARDALLRCMAHNYWRTKVYMNYPGIGLGRLSRAEVSPIIATLPDNVYVVSKPDHQNSILV